MEKHFTKFIRKEDLNEEEKTKENKEKEEELDLNIEDEKIRTFLQNIKIKKMGIDLSKPLISRRY